MTETKRCTKCGETKPLDEFHRNASSKDGRMPRCKACRKEETKDYRKRYADEIRERKQEYYSVEKNRALKREYDHRYYTENKQRILEQGREWTARNADRVRTRRRTYYLANKDQVQERVREWYRANRERALERARDYREKNADRILHHYRTVGYVRRRKYHRCVTNPACPNVGERGAEFVTYSCEVCGKEFRRLKSAVDYEYQHRGYLPRFCSHACMHASMRKDYKSPYARNIERIKKEVGE